MIEVRRRTRTARRLTVLVTIGSTLLLAGCVDFSGSEAAPFTGPPTGQPTTTAAPPPVSKPPKPPGPCIDPDPLVLATCLTEPTAVLPTSELEHAYVSERGGVIKYTTTDAPNTEVLRVDVDPSGDGGLTSIALAPAYEQNRLFYAYISTGSDNRVVRVTPGDEAKVILSGIPKGPTGNAGSLLFVGDDLFVATGNAGDANAARNPASLAGKVLRIESPGTISPARPQVIASDGGVRASLCQAQNGGPLFVADQGATEDRLRVVSPTKPASIAWTWPNRPGLAGCAVVGDTQAVMVSESRAGKVEMITLPPGSTVADKEPVQVLDRARYGVFGRLSVGPKGLPQGATVNKALGTATPNDDRVVLIPMPSGGEGAED